jgi:hypothetical protein
MAGSFEAIGLIQNSAMRIDRIANTSRRWRGGNGAFTLVEVAFAGAIAALVLAGMFEGYNIAGRRAQFSACSLAANAKAMQQIEGVFSANWVPAYGQLQLLGLSSTQLDNLCLPSAASNTVNCTNYVTVKQVSTNPTYALIQVSCVWTFPSYGGVYTNTVSVLRAPNE